MAGSLSTTKIWLYSRICGQEVRRQLILRTVKGGERGGRFRGTSWTIPPSSIAVSGPPEEPHGRAGPGHWSLAASSDAGKGNWLRKKVTPTRSPPSPSGRRVAFTKPGQ